MVARNDPRYGRGVVEVDGWVDGTSVLQTLKDTFQSSAYVAPKLPAVAMQLLKLSQQPDSSLADVRELLEHDAVLCGEVLRVAQSPLYAGRANITSIQVALSRLGMKAIRDLVFQVAASSKVFRAKPYQKTMDELRTHSTAVAHAARVVCRYTSLDAEYAFMCGLLHDVGKAGALIALADDAKTPPAVEDVWHAVEEVHAEASEVMAKQWELPMEITMVIGAHHTVRIQGYAHPIAAAVNLADRFAKEAGYGISAARGVNARLGELSMPALAETLQLTDQQIDLAREQVVEAFEQM